MDKRNHPRIAMPSLTVDASDGAGFFHGVVADVSRFGLCVMGLPKRINGRARKIIVVVSGHKENFKMHVRPRWTSTDGNSKFIGAEIVNPPWAWTEFVMRFEPKKDVDVWAEVHI